MFFPALLAFDDVGMSVFRVAWITLVLLIVLLFAGSIRYFASTISRADDIVFESVAGLDRASALTFHELYRGRRPKNVAVAWILAVVTGPFGAFGYLGDWPKCFAALLTLNGLGAWWIESWFSVPQLVLIANRRSATWAMDQLPYVMKMRASSDDRS